MTEFDFAAKYRAGFAASELGRIHALLPRSEMASAIAIRFLKGISSSLTGQLSGHLLNIPNLGL